MKAEFERSSEVPEYMVDAAIRWQIKLEYNSPPPADQQRFEEWLQADVRHAQAWERVSALRQPFKAVPSPWIRDTLLVASAQRQRRARRSAVKFCALLGLGAGTAWVAREHSPWQRLLADASTATGERKTLRLQDGTDIVLNTDSAIKTELTQARRKVELLRGEIRVTTGADLQSAAHRPFWVHTPYGQMEALGTRFTVRLSDRRALISVQEGAVALHSVQGGRADTVHSGESRWLHAGGTESAQLLTIDADGWVQGVIAGREMRLGDLLAELARYRPGYLVCDERVAELRVSGLVHTGDTDQALQFLVQTQPISVTYLTRYWVRVGPRAGAELVRDRGI
jgi:transmembrane sensor